MKSISIASLVIFLLSLTVSHGFGQSLINSSKPISSILNSDGSLIRGVAGSFSPDGYRLSSGLNGEPRFVASEQSVGGGCVPDSWNSTFSSNGSNDTINVIVSDGTGNLYFGGRFTSIQGFPAKGIAKWNGSSWSALGTGTGEVRAIAILGTDVYIGGNFAGAGGVLSKNVAKWNGTSWSAMGAGLGGGTHIVEAMAVYNGELYIGGNFNIPDGSPANGLVRWNGSSYSDPGLSGQVYSLAVSGGNLYVGGFVTPASDTTIGGLLKWDGMNWTGLGLNPASTTVRAIGFNSSDIWVGGSIRPTGSSSTSTIGRWNSSAWTTFTISNAGVRSFAFLGSDVYVGGNIERTGGIGVGNGIIKYDGSQWTAIGTGTELGDHTVNSIYVTGNTFLLGGNFKLAGGVAASNLATLTNGTSWAAAFPGSGTDGVASAIAVSGPDVYVGGSFASAGNITPNKIAKWNSLTNTWSSLGGGITGTGTDFSSVSTIAVAGGKVYAGGSFPRIGGVTAANIAVWNGTTWAPLGSGITGGNARVSEIVVKGDDVYVAGDFTTAGGVATNRIARWNGTSWTGYPTAPIPNAVTGLTFIGDDMYVSSDTNTSDTPNYLLKYDGATWTGLAPGMGGAGIRSIVAIGTDLYAGGGFSAVAGVSANRVAKWNGTSWSALGSGLPTDGTFGINLVFLGALGSDLIASGNFTTATGGPANHIARWNGSAWSPLGNGLDSYASRIVAGGGDLFVGGPFSIAGCNTSQNLARWRETVWTGAGGSDWHTVSNWGSGSVPPATAGVTISSADASITSSNVTIADLIVTGGRTLTIGAGRTLTVTRKLDVSGGTITGPGSLVVNDLSLTNAATVSSTGSLTVNGNLFLDGGFITGGSIGVTSCRPGAVSGGSSASFVISALTRCVDSAGIYRFPVGTGTVYSPVELANVVGTGNFTVEAKSGEHPGATGLPANRLQRWWSTTNGGIASADLTFTYSDAEVVGLESWYRVYSINGGTATQLPTAINTTTNRQTVTGVSSFSAWTLAEGTSSLRTLTGRVTNPNGRGASGVMMTLTDDQNNVRVVVTNPFGYYRFSDVATFRTYTVRVLPKKFSFPTSQQVVNFDEFTSGINFVSSDN